MRSQYRWSHGLSIQQGGENDLWKRETKATVSSDLYLVWIQDSRRQRKRLNRHLPRVLLPVTDQSSQDAEKNHQWRLCE